MGSNVRWLDLKMAAPLTGSYGGERIATRKLKVVAYNSNRIGGSQVIGSCNIDLIALELEEGIQKKVTFS